MLAWIISWRCEQAAWICVFLFKKLLLATLARRSWNTKALFFLFTLTFLIFFFVTIILFESALSIFNRKLFVSIRLWQHFCNQCFRSFQRSDSFWFCQYSLGWWRWFLLDWLLCASLTGLLAYYLLLSCATLYKLKCIIEKSNTSFFVLTFL